MSEGERRDHGDETLEPSVRDNEAEQKQQMVDAAQDVLDAEDHEAERRLVSAVN